MSRAKYLTVLIGSGLIVIVLLSEVFSTFANGIGPYQAVLLCLGLGIILVGLSPPSHWTQKMFLVVCSILVTLMLLEGMLLVLNRFNVSVTYPDVRELVNDEVLGKRTPAGAIGHDARGWRNLTALEHADIVTIGDSQTWGVNASLAETYPSVLSELVQKPVYNMAQGSYGAVQYRVLTEQALELSPQLVIIGLYFGNDFADAYNIVYGDYAHTDLRNPEFDFRAISQTIGEQARLLQPDNLTNLTQIEQLNSVDMTLWQRVQSETFIGKLLTNVGVFQTVDTGAFALQMQKNQQIVNDFPDVFSYYQRDGVLTFLTPAYRQLVVDLESPMITEGIRVTKQEFLKIASILDQNDIDLIVVLIPTKEIVYLPHVDPETINHAYQQLGEQEQLLRSEMIRFFDDNDIQYVDTLSELRTAVENDTSIYPPTFDGHPNPNGYRIIAETMAEFIKVNGIIN